MIGEDINSLLPGSFFGNPAFENRMPAEAIPGGGQQGKAASLGAQPWGLKMPPAAQDKANVAVGKVRDAKEKEGDTIPFFRFLGLNATWPQIGVYSILFILFMVGVTGLLSAAGADVPGKRLFK